jgi:hypothetical protein
METTEHTAQADQIAYTGSATYCPEDNKLRIYVGRVPRDDYEALRADGWTSTPKQDCDFVATWRPSRRDTCLDYAGIIEDEDQSPEDRAADRAERFGGYLDKRLGEATGHADRYDAGPSVHGFQSKARAVRAANRHDRTGSRAVDAWDKAEYWQQRTAGVISHALHVSTPGVRMGRIKILESALRGRSVDVYGENDPWAIHYRNRLAYENQMLEAQGGRAAAVDMEPGGLLHGEVIAQVNKSNATGRVVSVAVIGRRVARWTYQADNVAGTEYALYKTDTERLPPSAYQPPTEESRAKLAEFLAAKKAAQKKHRDKVGPCPIINPTDEDAEKFQTQWNERAGKRGHDFNGEPYKVMRLTQAQFSELSKGNDSLKTEVICETGLPHRTRYSEKITRKDVFKLRVNWQRVVILTDKPRKPIPWQAIADARAECPTVETMRPRLAELEKLCTAPNADHFDEQARADFVYIGWFSVASWSQHGPTEAGRQELKQFDEAQAARPLVQSSFELA